MSGDELRLGVITGAQGLRGEVKIKCFTAHAEDIAAYGPLHDAGGKPFALKVTRVSDGMAICAIKGVQTREAAEALKGTELFIPRSALPKPEKGEYYIHDLIGLPISTPDGTLIGTVRAIHDFGGGNIVEIGFADGDTQLLPFNGETIRSIDIAAGKIVMELPEII